MGRPLSRARGQTRRHGAVLKGHALSNLQSSLYDLLYRMKNSTLLSELRFSYSIEKKFFLFFFLEINIHEIIIQQECFLLVSFQEEQFDVGEIPSADLEDGTVSGEVEVRGPIVARNRDEAYSSRR